LHTPVLSSLSIGVAAAFQIFLENNRTFAEC
jgi:hypothetical protein